MAEATLMVTIHKTKKRVLWAETDKNFVDFLFCLFSVPMGQVLNFLNDNESFGCLRKTYQSVHVMENDFLVCDKDDLLKPKVYLSTIPSLLNVENSFVVSPTTTLASCSARDLFTCGCANPMFSVTFGSFCGRCKRGMYGTSIKHYVPKSNPTNSNVDGEGSGFVKGGAVKYIVTDDLSVTSKSSFSFLDYFKTMHIVDLNELEEKVLNVNVENVKYACMVYWSML